MCVALESTVRPFYNQSSSWENESYKYTKICLSLKQIEEFIFLVYRLYRLPEKKTE